MIDLDDLRLFRALGASRSLAAAARLLNLTPPAVTVRLQRVEERLGVRLAVRGAKGISLTDEGQR
ncbi:LysR family transcriptional regulator, partial [Pandoraea sp. B-6]